MELAGEAIRRSLSSPGLAILDNNRADAGGLSYLFHSPAEFCVASSPEEVGPAFRRIERFVADGYHAVGYFSYELGYCFSSRLAKIPRAKSALPLFCVGIYRDRAAVSDALLDSALDAHTSGRTARVFNCRLNMTRSEYLEQMAKVKRHIFDGDTYEVNYTLKYKFRYDGDPLRLFANLRKRQRVLYGAFLDFPGATVLSRSPELFIEKDGERIHTRPMKGTAKRGPTPEQDRRNAEFLTADAKTRAENVMIVDLLRNDLSRIGRRGSVRTADLFKVETYETLHQMVSTVSAEVDADISLERVLSQLFPCGSITGAPKVRTMEIIHDLEREARGIYTGAIGYVTPERKVCMNVAIRTLTLFSDGSGEMGVGSGVVHDSEPAVEYDECRLKGRFLTDDVAEFSLLECVLFDGRDYRHLARHLQRLWGSAQALGFECDRLALEAALLQTARTLLVPTKVRVTLRCDGSFGIDCSAVLRSTHQERRVAVAAEHVDSASWLLRHKVSLRTLYERTYAHYSRLGFYDVLFTNEKGEVTEATFNNVFIRKGTRWYTPPVSCGLLPGIQRQHLLEAREIDAVEKCLSVPELLEADEIFLTNAIRGVQKIELVPGAIGAGTEATPCCA